MADNTTGVDDATVVDNITTVDDATTAVDNTTAADSSVAVDDATISNTSTAVDDDITLDDPTASNNTTAVDNTVTPNNSTTVEDVIVLEEPHRIWSIPTTLEHLLIHLDMRTLLLIQQTSRSIHTTITTSLPLQKKLFFQPIANEQELITLKFTTPNHSHHFIIPQQDPEIFAAETPSAKFCLLNPLFVFNPGNEAHSRSKPDLLKSPPKLDISLCTSIHFPREFPARFRTYSQNAKAKGILVPSWDRMLVSQPPNLQGYPRGWDGVVLGRTVSGICGLVPRTREGNMFVVLVGELVGGKLFWEVLEREEKEYREFLKSLEAVDDEEGVSGGPVLDESAKVNDVDGEIVEEEDVWMQGDEVVVEEEEEDEWDEQKMYDETMANLAESHEEIMKTLGF